MNNGKIVVSICAETADEMIGRFRSADGLADIIELRLDCLPADEVVYLFEHLPASRAAVIYTLRSDAEGGNRVIVQTERDRLSELLRNSSASHTYVDHEFDGFIQAIVSLPLERQIISHHDFNGGTDLLDKIEKMLARFPASVIKMAASTSEITAFLPVWKLFEKAVADGRRAVPIAMGEAGKWTRILGLAHGAPLTYAAVDATRATAPGQISAEEMRSVFRVKELTRETRVYGVIGQPLADSKSVYIHNAAFVEAKIDAVFIPLEVADLDAFMRRMVLAATREVELNFAGFAVTMPYKQAIMDYLVEIDPVAKKVGAVNTVRVDGDGLIGYNTDAYGFITPLKEKLGDLREMRAAVIGAGGAARACVVALLEEGCETTVFARDERKATLLGEAFKVDSGTISNFKSEISNLPDGRFDIIVDATPLGMKGPHEDESLFSADELAGVKFVYDLVTSAEDTPIVRNAKLAGVPAIGGVEMLIAQGARQFEIWVGREANVRVMRAALMERMK